MSYFRVTLGILLLFLIGRYFYYNWIGKYFINTIVYFPHFHWNFLKPLPELYMYLVFGVLLVLAICITIGWKTRLSSLSFAIIFAYQHLIDKSNFLNHYYLVFLLCIILTIVSDDESSNRVGVWKLYLIRFQLAVVYFFGAIAKIRPDWILDAQPLKIWLLMNSDFPLIGSVLTWKFTAYFFSWAGLAFDAMIFPALLYKRTRKVAYFFVLLFHLLTSALFPIGMFPWIMIFLTPLCFSNRFHFEVLKKIQVFAQRFKLDTSKKSKQSIVNIRSSIPKIVYIFVILQVVLPFRHFFFPGNMLWTEQGFRFSWHIMAAHKTGYIEFYLQEENGNKFLVDYNHLLTERQLGQMRTEPGMIWQFAKEIETREKKKGRKNFGVYANSFVSLNGKEARRMIDPEVDLTKVEYNYFKHNSWITNFD
ncbi:MAG: HTTM domain-containing protein [Leptospiraceae bacterium]|nr:HTTM domain-containing protein [Leptospiraceae bacterium]